jgi:F1F0 ATPase subunit 2
MIAAVYLVGAFAAGLFLGTISFAGLWWTVRNGMVAANPALWFGLSTLLRMAFVIACLYLVVQTGLTSLLACICGLLVARFAVVRFARTH